MLVHIPKNKDDFITLKSGYDFTDPNQRDPWEPDPLNGHDALMGLAVDALIGGQGFARINPNDIFGNVDNLQQQARQQSNLDGLFMWPWR